MTQTHPHKGEPSLGAAAAAAAASGPKPTDAKPTDKPADKPAGGSGGNDGAAAASTDGKKKRESKRKVFVVIGEVKEFESIVQAEKFLNSPDAPENYTVLQGMRTRRSTRVSLR